MLNWNHNDIKEWILYEDREILVCRKPAGIAVQNARFGAADLESVLKNNLALRNPGTIPYLGVVHRLDQPVEGILVFAKTPAAASSLSRQISSGEAGKQYLAVTDQVPPAASGTLEDYLKKDGKKNMSFAVGAGTAGAKKAKLAYRVIQKLEDRRTKGGARFLIKIQLETGRHHQIRVQMAHAGMPLIGDRKYYPRDNSGLPLGLCACELAFLHPKTKKKMEFRAAPEGKTFEGFDISVQNAAY